MKVWKKHFHLHKLQCVGMQYLEAIDKLKKSGFKPKRSIYLSYVPGSFQIMHF